MIKILIALFCILFSTTSNAQSTASKDAQYVAITKAVVNYKIDDEEISKHITKLRQDKKFNAKLQKMLDSLNNNRAKNSKNRKVLDVLEKTGEELEKILE